MTELMAITGGLMLAAFVIFPMGTSTTSGTRFAPRDPFTWSKWREEAGIALWTLSPYVICRDVWQGYEDISGGFVRLLAFAVVLSALLTAVALVGWGAFSWLLS